MAVSGLCGLGLWLALRSPYRPRTFRIEAAGCRLVTDIVEPPGVSETPPQGYVILLHGLAANKRIMSYLAQGFAAQGLRVFVPDLPGHGRTEGTFSYGRADECSENLARELMARGLLDPQRTIVAGHSLGGAIALRVASRFPVAGVVAISPAPMRPVPGIPHEAIPFSSFGTTPPNTLVLEGAWESATFRNVAAELARGAKEGTGRYAVIPHATHVSILFDENAMKESQNWVAVALHLNGTAKLPSDRPLWGFLLGLFGILLLAGPFLRELLQTKRAEATATGNMVVPAKSRVFLEYAALSLGVAAILSRWNPLRAVHMFEADYCIGFLLLLGIALLALHWRSWSKPLSKTAVDFPSQRPVWLTLLAVSFAAFVLLVLFTAWTDLSVSEAWIPRARWWRFPALLGAALPYHVAEELVLGPLYKRAGWRRMLFALSLRLVVWAAFVAGIFWLHSGEILFVILIPYLAIICVLQRWSMDVVREVTASPAASALFGAILLAGFCLVAFPTA